MELRKLLGCSVGVAAAFALGCEVPQGHQAGTAESEASLESMRLMEPRLSGDISFAPCRPERAGVGSLPAVWCARPEGEALDRAVDALIAELAARSPETASDYRKHALISLAYPSQEGQLDEAVRLMEQALLLDSENPERLVDLGAARLARAHFEQRPGDLVSALDATERALEQVPDSRPALLNRALTLQRFGLCFEARAAWDAYLAVEPDEGWRGEGEARRAELACSEKEEPAELGPMGRIEKALAGTFPEWARAQLAGEDERASQHLASLREEGADLFTRHGDAAVSGCVEAVESADSEQRKRLAQAHRAYGKAMAAQGESKYGEADGMLGTVLEQLGDLETPLGLWARYGRVLGWVTAAEYGKVEDELPLLFGAVRNAAQPALAGRLHWKAGLMAGRTGDYGEARALFREAGSQFGALRDVSRAAGARALQAETSHALGLWGEAWQARFEALQTLGLRPSLSLHNLLLDASIAAREQGWPYAALTLQSEGLNTARALNRSSSIAEALLWRSKIWGDLDRHRQALTDLEEALGRVRSVPDGRLTARLTADIQEARGRLLLTTDPPSALEALDEAVPLYRKIRYSWKLPSTLHLRARVHRALGADDPAEVDLLAAVGEIERRDRSLPDEPLRYHHLELAQSIFDDLMLLEVERGRPEDALLVSERARRTPLLYQEEGLLLQEPPDRKALDFWLAGLPSHVAVVETAWVDDEILVWTAFRGTVRLREISAAGLRTKIDEFFSLVSTVASDRKLLEVQAEALFTSLVKPWLGSVEGAGHLVLIPDRHLHQLPFAALRDPDTGRWLTEDFTLSSAPSFAFAAGSRRWQKLPLAQGSALLVGDPAADISDLEGLTRLPYAADEIDRLRSFFPDALVLEGEGARRGDVLTALREAREVHYAGHALANPHRPWASLLPLAPSEDGGSGLLLASDIQALPLRRRGLVVLSACGMAATGDLRSAGVPGLVNAFLAIGAESVVASAWQVNDRSIGRLVESLHREVRRGASPAEALRLARQPLLEQHPFYWAGIGVTGLVPHESLTAHERR